jgi:hypothetical protein
MRTKRAWLAAMLSLLVLPGAASTPSYDPRDLGPPERALVDCTEEVSAQMSWPTPVIPPAVRQQAMAAASHWAADRCYVPCAYEMCGTIRSYTEGRVTIYVSHRPKPDPDAIGIGPEAEVTFRLPGFAVIEEKIWHGGCRAGAPDCKLGGN